MTSVSSPRRTPTARPAPRLPRELRLALLVQVLVIPIYAAVPALGLLSQFLWDAILMQAFTWLVVTGMLIRWSGQGRPGLVLRPVWWALLSWTTPLGLPFLVLVPPIRRLLVPGVPATGRHPFWTTTGSLW